MIKKLGYENTRIFDTELSDDKTMLIFTEACDMCFQTELTKAEVIELANDLMAIAHKMEQTK